MLLADFEVGCSHVTGFGQLNVNKIYKPVLSTHKFICVNPLSFGGLLLHLTLHLLTDVLYRTDVACHLWLCPKFRVFFWFFCTKWMNQTRYNKRRLEIQLIKYAYFMDSRYPGQNICLTLSQSLQTILIVPPKYFSIMKIVKCTNVLEQKKCKHLTKCLYFLVFDYDEFS